MNLKQRRILRKLVSNNGQRFSSLQEGFLLEDKFPYHLKQLVKNGLVNKRDECYFLTKSGMRATAYFDARSLEEYNLKIPRLVFVCKDREKYRLTKYLEFGSKHNIWYNLPGGNVVFGETINQACVRLLKGNYEVDGEVCYRATKHLIHYATDGDVLFDDILLIFDVVVIKRPAEHSKWLTINEICKLKKRHPLIDQFIIEDDRASFSEGTFVQNFGFEEEDLGEYK